MTPDPDTMTAEQLRDALALAAGWKPIGNEHWHSYAPPDSVARGALERYVKTGHPIPPLSTPEALGVVAGMIPVPPMPHTIRIYRDGCVVEYFEKCDDGSSLRRTVSGLTETIARARLVLKVLAAESAAPALS